MTDEWQSLTHGFTISGYKGYVIVATDEHGGPSRWRSARRRPAGCSGACWTPSP